MAPLEFQVNIRQTLLVQPETPTPREFKYLSNIDDQTGLRNHIPFAHFYAGNSGAGDPIPVIKKALAKALVHYYPIAGRLRNGERGKLVVDCNGEGAQFVEADAVGVTLAEIRAARRLKPPFACWERLLVEDVWGSFYVTHSPLLRMQVTRLACGGFVLAYTFNHCVSDAFGALQFVSTMAEFARDPTRKTPSRIPAWGREVLKPRSPPIISFPHPEYQKPGENSEKIPESQFKQLAQTSVFFSPADITALKQQVNRPRCPTFDVIAACLWRARTRALRFSPENEVRLLFPIDTRFRLKPVLPEGYYGSAVVFPCARTTASNLCLNSIGFAADLIGNVKQSVDDEYRASVLDLIEVNGRAGFRSEGAFVVSDMSRLGYADVDFGWGPAVYGGPARAGTGLVPGMVTSVIGYKNDDGVNGLLALVSLEGDAAGRFEEEVNAEITRGGETKEGFPHIALSAL